jgi:hypothetical protein
MDGLHRQLADAGIVTEFSARMWGDGKPSVVVAIPATGEKEALGETLSHIAAAFRHCRRACGLVVFANNCADLTGEIVARKAPELPGRVVLLEGSLESGHAHAGWARRTTLDAAAHLCAPDGTILTTDADTRVAPDWVETLCATLDGDFDLVCGQFSMAAQPSILARAPAMRLALIETAYATLQDRVRHCCDQLIGRQPIGGRRPHYVEAGASIGITRTLYRRLGGLPPVPSSEDRALVRAAELSGARILYSSRSGVTTSNRLVGRARGGLAETLRRWLDDPDPLADQRLRPVDGIAGMWANALAVATARPDGPAAIRHAVLEDEWRRSITEPRMPAVDLESAIASLAAFLQEEVEPVFASWRGAYA